MSSLKLSVLSLEDEGSNTFMILKIKNFLLEVRAEMRKVVWPTKQETIKYTIAVIGISIVMAAFFGGLDAALSYLLETYLLK